MPSSHNTTSAPRLRVCAIVLDYFGAEKTRRCVESLVGQEISKVYVVDNSAEPVATAALERVLENLRRQGIDFALEIIRPGQNIGFARGVNISIRVDMDSLQGHDGYLLINNDATADAGMVRLLVAAMMRSPEVAAVGPTIIGGGMDGCGRWYHRYSGIQLAREYPLCFFYLSGCCVLVHKKLIVDRKLLDELFFMYGEDTELAWRVHRRGLRIVCEPLARVFHQGQGSTKGGSFFYEYHMARAHLLLVWRTWRRRWEMPLMFLGKVGWLICRGFYRCLYYRTPVPLVVLFLMWFPLKLDPGSRPDARQ